MPGGGAAGGADRGLDLLEHRRENEECDIRIAEDRLRRGVLPAGNSLEAGPQGGVLGGGGSCGSRGRGPLGGSARAGGLPPRGGGGPPSPSPAARPPPPPPS